MSTYQYGIAGGGGGNTLFLGWYPTSADLIAAYPIANNGNYAYVSGTPDHIWLWDTGSSSWVDGGVGGVVQSVTGLDTDNTDPTNPIVKVSVDSATMSGLGTPASPLKAKSSDYTWNGVTQTFEDIYNLYDMDTRTKPILINCYNPNMVAGWETAPRSVGSYNSAKIALMSFVTDNIQAHTSSSIYFTGDWTGQQLTKFFLKLTTVGMENHSASGASPFLFTGSLTNSDIFMLLTVGSQINQGAGASVPLVTYIPNGTPFILPAFDFSQIRSDNAIPLIAIDNSVNPGMVIPYLLGSSSLQNHGMGDNVIGDLYTPSSIVYARIESDCSFDSQNVGTNAVQFLSNAIQTFFSPSGSGMTSADVNSAIIEAYNHSSGGSGIDLFWNGAIQTFEYFYNANSMDALTGGNNPINVWQVKAAAGPHAYSWQPRSVGTYAADVIARINFIGIGRGNGAIDILGNWTGQQMSQMPQSLQATGLNCLVDASTCSPFAIDKSAKLSQLREFSHMQVTSASGDSLVTILPMSAGEKWAFDAHKNSKIGGLNTVFPLFRVDTSSGYGIQIEFTMQDQCDFNGDNIIGDSTSPTNYSMAILHTDASLNVYNAQPNIANFVVDYIDHNDQLLALDTYNIFGNGVNSKEVQKDLTDYNTSRVLRWDCSLETDFADFYDNKDITSSQDGELRNIDLVALPSEVFVMNGRNGPSPYDHIEGLQFHGNFNIIQINKSVSFMEIFRQLDKINFQNRSYIPYINYGGVFNIDKDIQLEIRNGSKFQNVNGTAVVPMIYNASTGKKITIIVDGKDSTIANYSDATGTHSEFNNTVGGMTTPVDILANNTGAIGNIILVADSVSNISTLVYNWNAANPGNTIYVASGDDTQIPTDNIYLAGGVNACYIVDTTDYSATVDIYLTNGASLQSLGHNDIVSPINSVVTIHYDSTSTFDVQNNPNVIYTPMDQEVITPLTTVGTYNPQLYDSGRLLLFKSAGVTIELPKDSVMPFPINTRIDFGRTGAGSVAFSAAGGATINSKGGAVVINGQYVVVSAIKTDVDTWLLIGDLV